MGWLSARSTPRLDCYKMKRFLRLAFYLALGFILGATATYASAASTYGNTSTKGFKGGAWNGTGTIDSGRTAQTIESINVGGKYIPVPMLGAVGAAALEAAIIGLKAAPQALVVGGIISYLGSKGMQLINGELKAQKANPPVPQESPNAWCIGGTCADTPEAACVAWTAQRGTLYSCVRTGQYDGSSIQFISSHSNGTNYTWVSTSNTACPSGTTYNSASHMCESPFDYTGPNESDWDKIRNDPPLADVMKELCANLSKLGSGSYACPVSNQHAQATAEPLSDWKTDPLTGQQTRQLVKISPAPTTSNPERVEITIETETKTTTTNPTTGETETNTETKADDKTDFCVLHPDSIACSKLGDIPDAPQMDPTNKDVSITRQDWGPTDGTCPSDLSYTLKLTGSHIGMSYKPVCDGLRTFRPVVIGMGWLAAIFAFLGITRRAQG